MKRTLSIVLCAGLISLGGITNSQAADYAASVVDVVVVRPASFAATVVGSVFFVVALPFAAAANGVKETSDALVVAPGRFTFVRPVGDFESLKFDQTEKSDAQSRNSARPSGKTSLKKMAHRRKPSLAPPTSSPPTRPSMPT